MKNFLYTSIFSFLILNSNAQDWTWLHGPNIINTYAVYGNKGVASPTTVPGSRHGCATWSDAAGNLWLFGGEGLGASFFSGWLNDMWKYNISTNEWTWIKGDSVVNKPGIYGTQGVSSPANNPGSREFMLTWTDAAGNFWMYGGDGYSSGPFGNLNDLWKYNPGTNEWTWMKGSNLNNQTGIYGTLGVSAVTNLPGGRYSAANWKDASGNLWMFGGFGYPATGPNGNLNDLWKYNPITNEWTWIKGSNLTGQNGLYGIMGVGAPPNNPGGREFISSWTDASGNMWLFGGYGHPASGPVGYMNDLWKYNPVNNRWTWMNGTNIVNQNGTYGPLGISSPATIPGARYSGAVWTDKGGNFWLYGGLGYPAAGGLGRLNDLFKYNPVSNEFTYMKGSNIINQYGTYGTKGVTNPLNTPGARYYTNTWLSSNSEMFMWGGFSFPVAGAPGNMNEMWRFNPPCNAESMTTASQMMVCNGNNTTLTAVTSSTGTVTWYASPTSTTSIGTGTNLTVTSLTTGVTSTTYTYYAEVGTCTISPTRIPITLTVNPNPTVTAISNTSLTCAGQTTTLVASGATNYVWNPGALSGSAVAVTPTISITYTVTGTDMNGCWALALLTQSVSACVGITTIQSIKEGITVFPNPNTGKFNVTTTPVYDDTFISIYNLLGEEILRQKLTETKNNIELNEVSKSIYYYRIVVSDKVISSGKLIVE